jgi:uncharacterized repeat protein (TIGR01451 family)
MMTFRKILHICLWLCVLSYSVSSQAQVQRSFLNTSFEQPVLAGGACYAQVYDNAVPFWSTTATTATQNGTCTLPGGTASGLIEIWANSFQGVAARDGVQFAELNADQPSALYQNVCINNGETVSWALSHRGRGGLDTMVFVLGDTPASLAPANIVTTAGVGGILRASTDIAGNGTIVNCQAGSSVLTSTACTVAKTGTWADYKGAFTWNGTSGVKSVGFGAIGGGSSGNFLDAITLTLKPYLEFNTPPASGLESVASPAGLGIKVSGNIPASFTVPITVTGGTATLGTDFTTPTGVATFNVTIPAGNYTTATTIPLGIVIINDTFAETNETITFSMAPSTAASPYVTASTNTCGGAVALSSTYTIIDDDRPKISINKIRQGGATSTVDFGFTGSNGLPTAITNITTTADNVSTTVAALTNVSIATDGAAISFTETQPGVAWQLTSASCIDANAGIAALGNTNPATNLATFVGNTVTIPAANVLHTSQFNCTVTNKNNTAALTISKTDGKSTTSTGGTNNYVITLSNAGPAAADGSVLTDVVGAGLTCPPANVVTCTVTGTGAVCPAGPLTFANLTSGITIATLPANGALQFAYACTVN